MLGASSRPSTLGHIFCHIKDALEVDPIGYRPIGGPVGLMKYFWLDFLQVSACMLSEPSIYRCP